MTHSSLHRAVRKGPAAGTIVLVMSACGFAASVHADGAYPHAQEPIGTVRQLYDGALTPDLTVNTLRNIERLFPTRSVLPSQRPRPFESAPRQLTQVKLSVNGKSYDLFDYLAVNRVVGMLILKDGKIAYETYQYGNTEQTRWTSMSVAKAITSTLVGAAVKDGYIGSLEDPVTKYVPRLEGTAYQGVSIRDILMMSSGVRWNETYTDPNSDRRRFLEAQISQRPGATMDVMAGLARAAPPGTRNNYSTGETQVVGEVLRGAIKKPIAEYLSEKIWKPYGMQAEAKWWLDSPDGTETTGTGLAATLRDFARFGQFFLDGGVVDGRSILPDGWVAEATSPKVLKSGEKLDYGYQWWTARTPQSKQDGAYFAAGIFGQFIYIDPKERVIVTTIGAESKPGMKMIPPEAFFDAVVAALH